MERRNSIEKISSTSSVETLLRPWYHKLFGLGCSLISAITFAAASILFRLTEDATPFVTSLVIFLPQYLILLPFITVKKFSVMGPNPKSCLLLVVRGFVGSSAVVLTNVALTKIPVNDTATLCTVSVPVAAILARLFLKEPCGFLEGVVIIFTVAGVVFIAEPAFIFGSTATEHISGNDRIVGVLLGLLAAIMSAITCIIIRILGKTVHTSVLSFYFTWTGFLSSVILIPLTETYKLPCLVTVGYMFLISSLQFISVVVFTVGLQYEEVGPVTLMFTSQVAFGYLFEYIFLQNLPSLYGVIGSLLILLSACSLIVKKIRES